MILYRGPSMIDRNPIVAIATGYNRPSKNTKTGAMVQVWILREDIHPVGAVMEGHDKSICGSCRHRGPLGKRSCYVNVGKAPSNVWKSYQKGRYETCPDLTVFGADKLLRLGAYGDPGAVPIKIWRDLTARSKGWTGYTHLWQSKPHLKSMCMASVDTPNEHITATLKGWRTFRVTSDMRTLNNEIMCPASKEAGMRTTCQMCKLCNGQKNDGRKSIMIMVHGSGSKHYAE